MFYYYGAKRRLAPLYPAPLYDTVIEPFGGSAAYGVHHLVRGNIDYLVVIEKDPRVVALWHRLLAMTPTEILNLPIPEAGTKTADFLHMTAATSNAVARCKTMTVTPRMQKVLRGMYETIARVHPFVEERVAVVCADYRYLDMEATWFVDPPYQVGSTPTKTVYPKGRGYAKTCTSDDLDFVSLGRWCQSRPGQVIVAEQMGADWLPFFHPLVNVGDSQGKMRTEAIWMKIDDPSASTSIRVTPKDAS